MKKPFQLTRKGQNGQVALFVALIFQVIFIFFALLINVGLLVHHKINLQQSTDIAAYYGAMKQAEILNAISHINFQMRQAWKLLAWRYRVLGTFGFQTDGGPNVAPQFPMRLISNVKTELFYNVSSSDQYQCPIGGTTVNVNDIPFFCVGHSGLNGWNPSKSETYCKINCNHIEGIASVINAIPLTGGATIPFGGDVAGSTNLAIYAANNTIANNCNGVGPKSVGLLAILVAAYFNDVESKKSLIQILGSNLSLPANQILDLDGKKIATGMEKTFDNNLTDANLQGKIKFEAYNGLDTSQNNGCGFSGNKANGTDSSQEFLKELKFKYLQYFIQTCVSKNNAFETRPHALFNSSFDGLNPVLKTQLITQYGGNSNIVEQIEKVLVASNYILGYEKNPWCQVYVGAKAQSKPKIPFLPISTVTLSAVSVAKPFGGQIGPWYGETWQSGNSKSTGQTNESVLPLRDITPDTSMSHLVNVKKAIINYSNFLGDQEGLSNTKYLAAYHSMLLHRSVNKNPISGVSYNHDTSAQDPSIDFVSPQKWPAFTSWDQIRDFSSSSFDYLAMETTTGKNSHLRDMELSVVAPNQFDLANYSIDADYYNNYYLKLQSSIDAIHSAAASSISFDKTTLRPDYGYNESLADRGVAKSFSVRHQMHVTNKIIKETDFLPSDSSNGNRIKEILKFLPDHMASLLTGWTYNDFNDYNSFPNQGPDAEFNMTFGKCTDNWTTDNTPYGSPVDSEKPPTPGNCVTGGRTGYSVKLVAPKMVNSGNPQELGGPNSSAADIANPIDPNFLKF